MIAASVAGFSIAIAVAATWLICWRYRAQNRERPEAKTNPGTQKQSGSNGPPDAHPVSVTPELQQPADGEDRTTQKSTECKHCNCVSTCIQGAALLGLAIYCYFTYETWEAAKLSIDASTAALHVTERPWVSASGVEITNIHPITMGNNPDGHFDVDVAISFKNSGASVAREGATRVYLYPGYSGNSFELASVPTTGISSETFVAPFAGITGKSPVSLAEIWDRECKDSDAQANAPSETGFVLAPGASVRYYETVINNGVTLGNMTTQHFMVLGCVSYRDGFNIQHHTRYCFIGRSGSGSDPNAKSQLVDCALRESAD